MKKLMLAAALCAAAAGAFADGCGEKTCVFGYQIKIYLKTTAGYTTASNTTTCVDGSCVRVPGIKRMAGFIYGTTKTGSTGTCGETGCECNAWDGAELLLWDYDTKLEAMPKTAKIDVLDRIYNGDSTTVEMAFTLDDMKYAGFGRVAKRENNWTLKYAMGFGAGTLPAPECTTCKTSCGATECSSIGKALAWAICASESTKPTETPVTAAYGKWTIDWSATVYNRYMNNQTLIPGAAWETITEIPFTK